MIAHSALAPVSEAVAAILNVESLLALCPQGIVDDIKENSPFPVGWYTLIEVPWLAFEAPGMMLELGVHMLTQYAGHQKGQEILGEAVALLSAAGNGSPVVAGFTLQWLTYMGTVPLPDELINGVKTKHVMARFEVVATEVAA